MTVSRWPDEQRLSGSPSGAASATFLFADIAGYTALTEAHGDEQAADLVAEFSTL
jgi:class 3 adenylate cyclase